MPYRGTQDWLGYTIGGILLRVITTLGNESIINILYYGM